jgi:cytochrome c6
LPAVLIALSSGQKTGLAVMAAVFVVFALVSAMGIPRFWPSFPGRGLKLHLVLSVLFTAAMMSAVIVLAKEDEAHGAEPGKPQTAPGEPTTPAPTGEQPAPSGNPTAGAQVFAKAGCGGCHTLKAANSTGQVGPNLDEAKPPESLVVERVTNGKPPMPSFKGQLSEEEIRDVAAYVVASTRGG